MDEHGPDCFVRIRNQMERESNFTVTMEAIDKLRTEANHYLDLIRTTNVNHIFMLAELRSRYNWLYDDISRMLKIYRIEHNV